MDFYIKIWIKQENLNFLELNNSRKFYLFSKSQHTHSKARISPNFKRNY